MYRLVLLRPCFFVVDDGGTFWRLKKRTFERIPIQPDGLTAKK